MLVVRLVHLKEIPNYESILELLKKNLDNVEENKKTTFDLNITKKKFSNEENEIIKSSKDQIKNITQTKPILSSQNKEISSKNMEIHKISSFEDLVFLSSL